MVLNTIIEIDHKNYTENVIVTENNINEVLSLITKYELDWKYVIEGELLIETTVCGIPFLRKSNAVKSIGLDTFGEDYRNRWIKIRASEKGEFFTASYYGGHRMYLDNDQYIG